MMNLKDYQNLFLPAVEKEMQKIIKVNLGKFNGLLQEMLTYHFGWGIRSKNKKAKGKRIRPLLALLCTEGAGESWEKALPSATAVELIHNFSLIHDDIKDKGNIRRGRETIWKRWGTAQAINAGDTMYLLAYKTMLGLRSTCTKEVTIKATSLLCDTFLHLTYGQYLDISFESQRTITLDDYWQMVEGKTAALLGCSTKFGALISSRKKVEQDKYYQFGYLIGMAFKVYGDWLGMWGQPEKVGKSTISGLVQGKKTLPVLLGMRNSKIFTERWRKDNIIIQEA